MPGEDVDVVAAAAQRRAEFHGDARAAADAVVTEQADREAHRCASFETRILAITRSARSGWRRSQPWSSSPGRTRTVTSLRARSVADLGMWPRTASSPIDSTGST